MSDPRKHDPENAESGPADDAADTATDTAAGTGERADDLPGEAFVDPAPEAEPERQPETEPATAEMAHPDDEHAHHDEHGHPTMAGRALRFLVVLMIGFGLALWAAPRIGPHLPNSIAGYLVPTVDIAKSEIAEMQETLATERSAAAERISALTARVDALAEQQGTGEASATDGEQDTAIAALQADLASARETLDALAPRVAEAQSAAAAVTVELDSLQSALASFGEDSSSDGSAPASAEVAAAVAALSGRMETLSTQIAGLAEKSEVESLASRLDAAEASMSQAVSEQEAAAAAAAEAERKAALSRAAAALQRDLAAGEPFAEALGELEAASGQTAPAALSDTAGDGVVLANTLRSGFSERAHAAITASIAADASGGEDSGLIGDAETWLRSRLTGRPVTEQAGDDVGAILSRVEARVGEGKLAEALTEAESLPDPAKAALGDWLDSLRARVAAEAALGDYLAAIGADS